MGEKRKRSSQSSEIEASVSDKEAVQEEKVRTESELPSTPQPLTEENLALLEEAGGESARSSTTQPSIEEDLALSEGSMPPKDAGAKETAEKRSAVDASTLLRLNKHFINDKKAKKDNPTITDAATKLIERERHSAMSEKEQEGVLAAGKRAQRVNEDTFIDEVWGLMLRNGRNVHNPEKDTELDGKGIEFQLWSEDHLGRNRNQMLSTDCIPPLDTYHNAALDKILESLPKLARPQPDITYGILEDAFTQEQLLINFGYKYCASISPTLYHVFLVMEFKSNNGNVEEARAQACRDGATVVNAMRQFKGIPKESFTNPADPTQCMAFSLVVEPNFAELYVHWALVEPGDKSKKEPDSVSYHMNLVKTYLMNDPTALKSIRYDVDNILDWVLLERKKYILEHTVRIQKWQAKNPVAKPTSTPRKKRCITTVAGESADEVQVDEEEN